MLETGFESFRWDTLCCRLAYEDGDVIFVVLRDHLCWKAVDLA